MSTTMPPGGAVAHQVFPETAKRRMAHASLASDEMAWRIKVGGAIRRAIGFLGWSDKEAAARLRMDDSQFGKWLSGTENQNLARLLANDDLRRPLMALLNIVTGADVMFRAEFRKEGK